ncbi:MAG: GNAT family N-acetyltransferase [Marinilabiliales bacterium]|nr:GNAT family N-acetyltransferase [Marinilabiliales bacterium]
MNNITYRFDTTGVDWHLVPKILEEVGMAFRSPEKHEASFLHSYAVVFAWRENQLIGFGRAISDGVCQAALYDVAILPDFQGMGIGREVVSHLIRMCEGCNVILYAAPGKEPFYQKLQFSRMKTAMALFSDPERKRERGFIE